MQWKILVAALIILGVVAVMAFTEPGKQYTSFLSKYLGSFVVGILNPEKFQFELNANKEALYGQSFPFSDSTFTASGTYETVSIDGKVWKSKASNELNVNFAGDGKIEFTQDGKLVITASTNSVDLNDFTLTNEGNMNVNIEIAPSNFTLAKLVQSQIALSSTTGEVKKFVNNTVLTADFVKSNIAINNFNGTLQLANDTISLTGYATSITGSDFKI